MENAKPNNRGRNTTTIHHSIREENFVDNNRGDFTRDDYIMQAFIKFHEKELLERYVDPKIVKDMLDAHLITAQERHDKNQLERKIAEEIKQAKIESKKQLNQPHVETKKEEESTIPQTYLDQKAEILHDFERATERHNSNPDAYKDVPKHLENIKLQRDEKLEKLHNRFPDVKD